MTNEQKEKIIPYVQAVEAEWKTGQATEHTYRPMLKRLVEELLPRVLVINEPKHIECGAPDYLIRRGTDILGFIEAKDLGDGDLDGRDAHKEQFNRYKESLDTICFTDYLDFHFYDHGDFIDSVRIGEPKGDRIAVADEATLDRFVQLLAHFAEARPQHITSPARLAKLMAGKAKLLAEGVRQYLKNEQNADSVLAQQMEAFRSVLIHDITIESFADIFAQTVTYGMFAARLHDKTPDDFSRAEAATLIPKTNPLLRQMFQYIAMDTDDSIEWIVDDLVSLFAAVDVEKLMRGYRKEMAQSDPLLHFYEDFLAAYDPKLRKTRGVWYTPKPVVDFIVRSVDLILARDFNLPGGLADSSKVTIELKNDFKKTLHSRGKSIIHKDVHRVQILDPAAGTGTFLAETVKLIHEKVSAAMGAGAWQGYVADNLLPRLNGFEILMASYAMAHLKLDMLLAETGYEHKTNERLRVFLTNSLEPYDKDIGTLFAAALSREANEANFVKRDCPVMVVMGNPPYSGESQNKGRWIGDLMNDYKMEPGGADRLKEKNPKWLNNDYVKFIRYGQQYIEKNCKGVLAYICPRGYLSDPTFRGMRWNLLRAFDDIYVLDLHGGWNEGLNLPDGARDENVFDIKQGVSVGIFVKRDDGDPGFAKVHHAEIKGPREVKYDFLCNHSIESLDWDTVALHSPFYFFAPKNFAFVEEYQNGFSIGEFFQINTVGVVTANDKDLVAFSEEELRRKIDAAFPNEYDKSKARKYAYRPFDERYLYYDVEKVERPRDRVMVQMGEQDNVALLAVRQLAGTDWSHVSVATCIVDDCRVSNKTKERGYVFPLYLYLNNMGAVEKNPNFNKEILGRISTAVGENITPEDVFNYIYGMLHMPSYREKYKEFLKIDFPRIPYPQNAAEFRRIAEVGGKLVRVHLLKDESVTNPFSNPYAKFEGAGEGKVEKVAFDDGRVYINADQYFAPVPEEAWNFYIGGYQPAQKWLKDRKGRVLTSEDQQHYRAIIAALMKTAALMQEL